MLTEKEKLDEELKLLEESLTLDVITREEYEDAKQRIESRLGKLEDSGQKNNEAEKRGVNEADLKKGIAGQIEEPVEGKLENEAGNEEALDEEDAGIESIKPKEKQKRLEESEEYSEKEPIEEEGQIDGQLWEDERLAKVPKPEDISEEGIEFDKKRLVYIAVMIILAVGVWYFFFSGSGPNIPVGPADKPIRLVACSSDEECSKEGSIGVCNSPGTENSECLYSDDAKFKLMVLNSNRCFSCDTGRVLSILNSFFPGIETANIDFETAEGKEIAEKFHINALPSYIANSSLQEARNYYQLYNAFAKAGDSLVMKNNVANANYYIEREEVPNKLDLFLKSGQAASSKAEENLKGFLDAFDGKVVFEKHGDDSQIAKELEINSFPAFLVNNKIKFSGVQSADKIKENFCQVNRLDECKLELSKSLV